MSGKETKSKPKEKITTIKLNKKTKDRLEKLRVYKRESYDEILQTILNILNACRTNPESARIKLLKIDKQNRPIKKKTTKS